MSATVAAALKKIAVAVLTDKKLRKTVLGILLGVIVIIVMPFAAIIGVLNGDVELDTDRFNQILSENMTAEEQAKMQRLKELSEKLETKMREAELTERQIQAAKTLCMTVLSDFWDQDGFADRLISCFAPEQSDAELAGQLNAVFGTEISAEEISAQFINEKNGG